MRKQQEYRVSTTTVSVMLAVVLLCAPIAQAATESRRAVVTHDASEIPQFTIQVDAFETLTEAVEFGYELPFDENTLGLAKFRQGVVVRYILALGTFYTYGEADGVLREMCPPVALSNCRVRYLGDLEGISADSAAVPQVTAAVVIEEDMPPLVVDDDSQVLEPEFAPVVNAIDIAVVAEDAPPRVIGNEALEQEFTPVVEAKADTGYFEQIIDEEDGFLGGPSVSQSPIAKPVQAPRVQLEQYDADTGRAYDGDLVYTVQIAAMYQKSDAEYIVGKIPKSMGRAQILPLIGGRGNLVYSVVVGRFAYKDKAQVFAEDVCDAVGLSGCWVKPLAMIERELEIVPSDLASLAQPRLQESEPVVAGSQDEPLTLSAPTSDNTDSERLIYTVQVAAMYDEGDAQSVASRIPAQYGVTEVVPIRSVNGDVVYSVTVGRFAYKDQGQLVAEGVCDRLSLSGCWVKPFALIEQARVEEW